MIYVKAGGAVAWPVLVRETCEYQNITSGWAYRKAPRCAGRHKASDQLGVGFVVGMWLLLWAEGNMSISITAQSRPRRLPRIWLGAQVAVLLVAIVLVTLTVARLETWYGVVPSDDSGTSWVFSGE